LVIKNHSIGSIALPFGSSFTWMAFTSREGSRRLILLRVYTKNPPKPGPNGTGFFTQRKAALSITVDSTTANYLTAKAFAAYKTPADIIDELVQKEIAAVL
jgi:hypothetical protein